MTPSFYFFSKTNIQYSQLQQLKNISVLENPVRNVLTIENGLAKQINIQVVDLMGRVLYFEKTEDQSILIETYSWNPGLYILNISDPESKQFYIQKLIKQ